MSEVSLVVFLVTSLTAAVPATLTLFSSLVTSVLLPAALALALFLADLVSAVLASLESVLSLLFTSDVLLFPWHLLKALLRPFVSLLRLLLAPLTYPAAGIALCLGAVSAVFWNSRFVSRPDPVRLPPPALYTFFITGALVGLLAGVVLWRISRSISRLLGWLDDDERLLDAADDDAAPLAGKREPLDLPLLSPALEPVAVAEAGDRALHVATRDVDHRPHCGRTAAAAAAVPATVRAVSEGIGAVETRSRSVGALGSLAHRTSLGSGGRAARRS
ncbi:unnamed protein product [Parascedosporium putredinis]|uniref:Uncharacterized protein n=1 Tax=Parascedosporium putredinis TaxID=1442378 RepID=A0A9P1M6S0_9PEZI|nr:unnamed protein product [Parascedosporium putredinis]CAI7987431.1 unnamed protein product [Parascedosporium putredinis]